MTPLPCRTLERIFIPPIIHHLESINLLSKYQHGFRKKRSCVTQLLECIEEWTIAIDEGKQVDIIYLDFKAAFDKVAHKRLLKKVWSIGIRGKVYQWIKNFLCDRYQRVKINGVYSEWKRVTSGVPQGSVLGPVLFLIYINDLPDVMNCAMKMFADDTKLYSEITPKAEDIGEQILQDNVFNACNWAIKWQMTFNTGKCKTMHIGNKKELEYFMQDSDGQVVKIKQVEYEKDLGVIIDENLNFRKHIITKVNLANRNVGLMFKNFTFMNKNMFLSLYKTMVRPHLEYASVIWSPKYKKDAILIENVQRRATRMVKELKGLSYSERLKQLGLPTLEYRRTRADVVQAYKLLKGIDKTDKELLTFSQTNTRGHQYKLFKPRANTRTRGNSFSHRVVEPWNSLSADVVEAPSLNAFKSRLNKHWTSQVKFNAKCYSPNS